ncbi:MAG: 1-deoxy-D-xylulose-5-phosphate synthase [Lentisphaerae bacterium ADurb.BinA184]|nr:MAG: 1-deoxy-D-xylulose-5-phosphate synthase [Lentisphaerae bacterium ADurb.BinA184]
MKPRPILDSLTGPADLKKLPTEQLPVLAAEIRAELLDVVSRCGGHLASNLGAVELTIALLRCFDPPTDKLVLDTGHQGYVYKLLTGRRALFQRLREDGGCCGFLSRDESSYDLFGAGHAGTAVSAAVGFAAARDRRGGHEHVVAVVGDGAMGCGVSLEGLNSVVEATRDVLLVINDNRMSIAPNVGALARHLNRLILGRRYNRFKDAVARAVQRIPVVGPGLRRLVRRVLEALKSLVVPATVFEKLGLRYIGPLDGHDLPKMIEAFERVKVLRQPIAVHVITEKGRGYPPAEKRPEQYHGMSRFDLDSGEPLPASGGNGGTSFSEALGDALVERIGRDPRVIAITAGMCESTGLGAIRARFPDRLVDVGIAEEHAVVFAAGLAAAGLRPVVAVYATFMQRAMDCVFHDVCLQNLPVLFCLDRAGVVADGPTHHGILDLAFWRALPNLVIAQPADRDELAAMLNALLDHGGPALIRYAKADATPLPRTANTPIEIGRAETLGEGPDVALWCLGRECALGLELARRLAPRGIRATVVNPRFVQPFDRERLLEQAGRMPIVTIENHGVEGGFGSLAADALVGRPGVRLLRKGWPRAVVPFGSEAGLRRSHGLDPEALAIEIEAFVHAGKTAP